MLHFLHAAKPDSERLVRELDALSIGDPADRSEFTLARIAREADRMAQADPAMAESVRGILAALRWDVERLDRHFERALQLAAPGAAPTVLFNHAVALERVHRIEQAAARAAAAVDLSPEDLEQLRGALWLGLRAGRLDLAHDLLARLARAAEQRVAQDEAAARILRRLEQAGGQGAVRAAFAAVHELLARKRVVTRRTGLWLGPEEEVGYVHEAWMSASAAAGLNEAIAAAMTDRTLVPEPAMRTITAYAVGLIADSETAPDERLPASVHAG
ncbi:MAG TPA: hypothetical protein ENK57_00735 [Polyangiaceae bacterium]|nr:hypothetical protein [Polyangiaceae bacterium]